MPSPSYLGGLFSVEGLSNLFHFGSGGSKRGSIPPGSYPITPDTVGRWGAKHGAIGINNNAIYDSRIGKTREGIEIHAGNFNHATNKLITAGCFGVDRKEFPKVKAQIMALIKEKGSAFLNVGTDGRASIASSKEGLPATTAQNESQSFGSASKTGMSMAEATKEFSAQSSAYLAKPSTAGGDDPFKGIPAGKGMAETAAPVKQAANQKTMLFLHGMESRYGKTTPKQVEASAKKYAEGRGMKFEAIPISGDKKSAQMKAAQTRLAKGDIGAVLGFSAGGYTADKLKFKGEKIIIGAPGAKGNKEFPGRHMEQPAALAKSLPVQQSQGVPLPRERPDTQVAQAAPVQQPAAKTPTLQQVIDKNRSDPRFSQFAGYESMIPDRNLPADQWAKQHGDLLNNPMVPDSARQVIQAAAKPQQPAPVQVKPEKLNIGGTPALQAAAQQPQPDAPLPQPRPTQPQPAGNAVQIKPDSVPFNTEAAPAPLGDRVMSFLKGEPMGGGPYGGAPGGPVLDYDFNKANAAGVKPDSRGHLPDTYKMPNHITFSDESIYHGKDGNEGGHWTQLGGDRWSFTPGKTNLENNSIGQLQEYFQKYEPNSVLTPQQPSPPLPQPRPNMQPPGQVQQVRPDSIQMQTGGGQDAPTVSQPTPTSSPLPPQQLLPSTLSAPLPSMSAAPGMSTMTGGGFPPLFPGAPNGSPMQGGGGMGGMMQPGLSGGTPFSGGGMGGMPAPSFGGGGGMGGGMMGGMGGGGAEGGGGMGGGGGGGLGALGKGIAAAFQKMADIKPNVTINKPLPVSSGQPDIASRVLDFLRQQQEQQAA